SPTSASSSPTVTTTTPAGTRRMSSRSSPPTATRADVMAERGNQGFPRGVLVAGLAEDRRLLGVRGEVARPVVRPRCGYLREDVGRDGRADRAHAVGRAPRVGHRGAEPAGPPP